MMTSEDFRVTQRKSDAVKAREVTEVGWEGGGEGLSYTGNGSRSTQVIGTVVHR